VGGVKAFLTKTGPFGLPVYAYVGGAIALIGGIWYFKTHSTPSAATAAPQTNYPTALTPPGGTSGGPVPLPYPMGDPNPVPPTPAFTTPPGVNLMGATVDASGNLDLTNFTGSTADMQNIMRAISGQSSTGSNAIPNPSITNRFVSSSPAPTNSQLWGNRVGNGSGAARFLGGSSTATPSPPGIPVGR
jgi:hypothetical protein